MAEIPIVIILSLRLCFARCVSLYVLKMVLFVRDKA